MTPRAPVFDLAASVQADRQRTTAFAADVRAALLRAARGPDRQTLACYLAAHPSGVAGDEKHVVDEVVREILEALGWSNEDWDHDRDRGGERPDWLVRLPGAPGGTPAFVVEAKATAVRDLQRPVTRPTGRESPIEQLRRYVLNNRVHGRVGLLCNGWVLEGWSFGSDGRALLVRVDLVAVAGENEPTEGQAMALATLCQRFSSAAFAETRRIEASFRPPPMTDERRQRLQAAVRAPDPLTGLQSEIEAWWERTWRENAERVENDPERLIGVLRSLIDRFSSDVAHQLDEALTHAGLEERRGPLLAERFSRVDEPIPSEQTTLGFGESDERPRGRKDRKKALVGALHDVLSRWTGPVQEARDLRRELEERNEVGERAAQAFRVWERRVATSVMVGASAETLRAEFARQTAYVYLVRLLLVRICEDKGLFRRKLPDGGLIAWEEHADRYLDYASGRSYEYLTRMADECAQNGYAHFYGASNVFDWYRMDDKMLVVALAVLNGFDLARIDTDIIGMVYSRYLLEGKHEQGRYYTPPPVVNTMLDLAGWTNGRLGNRRIADLACGSGSFLVEACRRLLDQHRDADGAIPVASIPDVLAEVKASIWGIDLNPFACYLAETNLVIQVLDLVRRAQEASLHLAIDRFNIYCDDALLVNAMLAVSGADEAIASAEQAVPELLKARVGPFRGGFDVLVGNPPYVRADEPSPAYLAYRERVAEQHWFQTQHKKWDLYVPFIEQYWRLLSDKPDARACMITIESIGTAPYAQRLRELLLRQGKVYDVVFTHDLELFSDAAWLDNIVVCFGRGAPPPGHAVRRWKSTRLDGRGLAVDRFDEVLQAEAQEGRTFRERAEVSLDIADTVPWANVCYVSKGMVLHANEREAGEVEVAAAYDPTRFGERLIRDRGRYGKVIEPLRFRREDLVSDTRDELHTRPFVGSREVLVGGVGRIRWLEYGPHARCPTRVSRPTFPELYAHPKVMFGTFTGVAVDEGSPEGFLTSSHSLTHALRWCLLDGVQNPSLRDARRDLGDGYDPEISRAFSEWYLCALAISEPIRNWMHANRRSMKEHVYPEDIKAIPVKRLAPEAQVPFVERAKELHACHRELRARLDAGFVVRGDAIEVPVRALQERFQVERPDLEHLTLLQARGRGLWSVESDFLPRDPRGVKARDAFVYQGRQAVAAAGEALTDRDAVSRLLARIIDALPSTVADRQGVDRMPATEQGLRAFGDFLDAEEAVVRAIVVRIATLRAEIDALAWTLYRPPASTERG